MSLLLTALLVIACGRESVGEQSSTNLSGHNNPDETFFPLSDTYGTLHESDDQDFYRQELISGLENPWGIAFLPDGEVLITERPGRLRMVRNGELLDDSVSGLPEIAAGGQGGLLDILLHPEYEENGWIYMTYSTRVDGGRHTALMRARLNKDELSLCDREILFEGKPGASGGRHFGSRIAIRDGYVYVSTGDRGTMNSAQDKTNHNGVIIRLYENGDIPEDNPFIGTPDALDEIYSYGHRNPQGMQFHPQTGELWIHEHGPRGGDEINIIDAAINYGWPEITYGVNYNGSVITKYTEKEGMRSAMHEWTPSIAPSGMAFVEGTRYPGWEGDIMIGSLSFEYLHRTVIDANAHEVIKEERLLDNIGRVREVRMGPDGYLYFTEESRGRLFRLIPAE